MGFHAAGGQEGVIVIAEEKKRLVADDEDFIRLMQVADEDPAVKQRLVAMLSLDSFNRLSLLNTWLEELKLRKAPKEFIRSLSYLKDDEVAQQALKILNG